MTGQGERRYMALNFYGKAAFMGQEDRTGMDYDPAEIKKAATEKKRQRLAAALRNNLQKRKQQARNRTEPIPSNSVDPEE
mgnify:CR=1 FL=1